MGYTNQPIDDTDLAPLGPSSDREPTPPRKSELYDLLSSETRRLVLDILADGTTPFDLEEVAEAVAERQDAPEHVDDQLARLAIVLHHNHLPRLVDAGLIEYDPESNRVETVNWAVAE